ncbi:hypothetical protein [Haloarcula montana]|nr:hypothetical protein [Haloarcula sp. GH36]
MTETQHKKVPCAIDTFKWKMEYRELRKYREVWGSWRDNLEETEDGDD